MRNQKSFKVSKRIETRNREYSRNFLINSYNSPLKAFTKEQSKDVGRCYLSKGWNHSGPNNTLRKIQETVKYFYSGATYIYLYSLIHQSCLHSHFHHHIIYHEECNDDCSRAWNLFDNFCFLINKSGNT